MKTLSLLSIMRAVRTSQHTPQEDVVLRAAIREQMGSMSISTQTKFFTKINGQLFMRLFHS